jgi:hypothetical protein
MPKIYLGYYKPLDDTDLASESNPILAGKYWLADNGTCKEHQRKGNRAAYRQTSHRLVKLPLARVS